MASHGWQWPAIACQGGSGQSNRSGSEKSDGKADAKGGTPTPSFGKTRDERPDKPERSVSFQILGDEGNRRVDECDTSSPPGARPSRGSIMGFLFGGGKPAEAEAPVISAA